MKGRNRLIVCLLAFGVVLFVVIQFSVIPHSNTVKANYITAQQSPQTHDLSTILKYKNKYMGNASNDINLFYHLPLSSVGMTFELFPDKLELAVNYKATVQSIGESKVKSALLYNSTAAFALIDNLQLITYQFPGASYSVKRADIVSLYLDFDHILQEKNWSSSVQHKMYDTSFVDASFLKVMK